jgi:hypothetical protein
MSVDKASVVSVERSETHRRVLKMMDFAALNPSDAPITGVPNLQKAERAACIRAP